MKNNKGIACVCNSYEVSGVALVDGEAQPFTYTTDVRDARKAKAYVADQMGTSPSQVLLNYTLKKQKFSIECSYDKLMDVLAAADISITKKTDSDTKE